MGQKDCRHGRARSPATKVFFFFFFFEDGWGTVQWRKELTHSLMSLRRLASLRTSRETNWSGPTPCMSSTTQTVRENPHWGASAVHMQQRIGEGVHSAVGSRMLIDKTDQPLMIVID
jgi:hypothetical protein